MGETALDAITRLQRYQSLHSSLRAVGVTDPESVINERLGLKDLNMKTELSYSEKREQDKILKELLVTNFAVQYETAINRIGKTCWFWFGACVAAAWAICALYYFDVVPPIFWWPIAAMTAIPISQLIRNLLKFCNIDTAAFEKLKDQLEKESLGYRTAENIIEYMKKGMGIQ